MHFYLPSPAKRTSRCEFLGCGQVDWKGEPIPWINTKQADGAIAVVIVLNAIIMAVDIDIELQSGVAEPALFWTQFAFLIVFVLELILRIAAGPRFFFSLQNVWGLLDMAIILASAMEYVLIFSIGDELQLHGTSILRIFRCLRILRIARIVRVCPGLNKILSGLGSALRAVFWVFCLLVTLLYVCALVCMLELGDKDNDLLQEDFGSFAQSLFTQFKILTLENYPPVVEAAAEQSWVWYFYFGGFIVFTNVMILNLVTGIVCESVMMHGDDKSDQTAKCDQELEKFKQVVMELMEVEGVSFDGGVSFEEFQKLVRIPGVRAALNTLDICLDLEDQQLFQIIDEDGNGSLSVDEFFDSLQRLRGSKDTLHSLLVQSDVVRHSQLVRGEITEIERKLSKYSSQVCAALEKKLAERISRLGSSFEHDKDADEKKNKSSGALSPAVLMRGKNQEPEQQQKQQLQQQQQLQQAATQEAADQLRGLLKAVGASTVDAREALVFLKGELQISRGNVQNLQARLLPPLLDKEVEESQPLEAAAQPAEETTSQVEPSEVDVIDSLPASPAVARVRSTAEVEDKPGPSTPPLLREATAASRNSREQAPFWSPGPSLRASANMERLRRLQELASTKSPGTTTSMRTQPPQRLLQVFHGHDPETRSLAKAATYESSDEGSDSPTVRRRRPPPLFYG